jgi:hypothetical protein
MIKITHKATVLETIDFFFNKLLPKKLIVWIVACILIFDGKLLSEHWLYVSLVYLGVNIIQKFSGGNPFKPGGA